MRVFGQWQIQDDLLADRLHLHETCNELNLNMNIVKTGVAGSTLVVIGEHLVTPGRRRQHAGPGVDPGDPVRRAHLAPAGARARPDRRGRRTGAGGAVMTDLVRLEVEDGIGTIRLDRPPMNALNGEIQHGLIAACREAAERRDVVGRHRLGRREGLRRRGRHQGDGGDVLHRHGRPLRAAPGLHPCPGPPAQADRGRHHRLRPRRRVRGGAGVRLPHRRRRRPARPARDPARHHPRRRRHPAARPPGRAGEGQGPRVLRPVRRGRTRRSRSASSTRSCPPPTSTPPRGPDGAATSAGPAYALRAAKEAIDRGLEVDLEQRPGDRADAVRRHCSPPRTAPSACVTSSRRARARHRSRADLARPAVRVTCPAGWSGITPHRW